MKLIDIIGNVILERTEDTPTDVVDSPDIDPSDVPDEFCMVFVDQPDDMVTPICQEFVRQHRERSDETESDDVRDTEPRTEPRTEPETEPRTDVVNLQRMEPIKKPKALKKVKDAYSGTKIDKTTTGVKKTKPIPTPQYKSESDIKNIKQVQTKSNIKILSNRIEQQIKEQSIEIQRKLKRFNIKPENMAYLIPLSDETTSLMIRLDSLGLKLPLMMVLYKNTEDLYSAMKQNKPFTEKEAKSVPGFINYNNFWEWSKEIYTKWGDWLKNNVVSHFPELTTTSLPLRK